VLIDGAITCFRGNRRILSAAVKVAPKVLSRRFLYCLKRVLPLFLSSHAVDPALLLHAAHEAAGSLEHAADVDSDDEGNEVEDFGPGAIESAPLDPAGAPVIGPLLFETESAARAARRATSSSAVSCAMHEHTWTAIESTATRFIRFLGLAYGSVDGLGGGGGGTWPFKLSAWH